MKAMSGRYKELRRVVITGMGCVTPIGIGREAYSSALSKGESGVRRIEAFDEQTFAPRFAIVSALDLRIAPW